MITIDGLTTIRTHSWTAKLLTLSLTLTRKLSPAAYISASAPMHVLCRSSYNSCIVFSVYLAHLAVNHNHKQ